MFPRLFTLGHITIPTYGVVVAGAVIAALLLAVTLAQRTGLDPDRIWTLGLVGVTITILVSKLLDFALTLPTLAVAARLRLSLLVLQSMGLPFALSALSATIYAVRVKIPLLRLMDILAPGASLGLGIASIGCLAAGCDYGLPTKSNWGLVFASRFAARMTGVPLGIPLYPTQIFDSLASLLICAILLALLARRHREGDGAATWLFLNGMTSFFLDFYRGTGDRDPFVIRVFAGTFTGTQLLAMLMVLLSGVIWSVAPKPQAEQPIHAR